MCECVNGGGGGGVVVIILSTPPQSGMCLLFVSFFLFFFVRSRVVETIGPMRRLHGAAGRVKDSVIRH